MGRRTTVTIEEDVDKGVKNWIANMYLSAAPYVSFSEVVNRLLRKVLTQEGYIIKEESEEVA